MPLNRDAVLVVVATVGTTLAPWGLAFIQSYAVDKGLRPRIWRYERVDVMAGAVMTGVIGLFIVVACAATLHARARRSTTPPTRPGRSSRWPAALASTLFGGGLARRRTAGCVDPPAVDRLLGRRGAGRRRATSTTASHEARAFYGTYGAWS